MLKELNKKAQALSRPAASLRGRLRSDAHATPEKPVRRPQPATGATP